MYQALYRKYRPTNFSEVVGQKIIVNTLMNAINNNKISHAYIFSGPRGTGKTSIAKIFAKTINCKNIEDGLPCEQCENCIDYINNKSIDIIEIDAASNNGVDEIRNLKNSVNLVPNNSKYKVYIVDEVHMLSTSAFNALLKTLEEPPEFVIFILATTELYKVPETIISRCQNFDFQRITNSEIVNRLSFICKNENIKITEESLKSIAIYSNGGMRDAISLLDQLAAYKNGIIEIDDVDNLCGLISNEQLYVLIEELLQKKINSVLEKINKYNDEGKNLVITFEKIVNILKNIIIYANASDYFENEDESKKYEEYLKLIDEMKLYLIIDIFNKYIKDMKIDNNRIMLAQLCILKSFSIIKKVKENNDIDNTIKECKKENNDIDNTIKECKKENDNNKKEKTKANLEIIKISNFNEFKNRRINNALAQFNKRDFIKFKNTYKNIKDYINDELYGSIVSILLDGEVKIKGNEYIVFVYSDMKFTDYFNNLFNKIEELLFKLYNEKYKVIAINENDWEIIKKDFNSSMKNGLNKYTLMDDIVLDIKNREDNTFKYNDIDNTFKEIVKYE